MAESGLAAVPVTFVVTRDSLHAVAEQIVAPARAAATGNQFSLVAPDRGFGTPQLPDGGCVRVDGLELVVENGDGEEKRAPLTSLQESAAAVGLPSTGLAEASLELDSASAAVLAAAYQLGDSVLREFYAEATPLASATNNQLWPEHFDIAIEHGNEQSGERATYGLSPGDADHPEPYFYVAPWLPPNDLTIWTADGFTGAQLGWVDLLNVDDPRATALNFFRAHRDALGAVG